jgi:uncharacterized repeat protein (TIGR03803 family)
MTPKAVRVYPPVGDAVARLREGEGQTSPSNNGYRPQSLLIDGQGNLYGTTYYGGNNFNFTNGQYGWGTLFKLSSSGQFTLLHEFSGPDGANPIGAVLLDSKGNLWGTT